MALAILGLIAAAFLGSLATTAQATFIADERATAESLARSQMEYVKTLEYVEYVDGATEYPSALIPSWLLDEDYSVTINVEPLYDADDIQKITVTVEHNDNQVFILEGYKIRYTDD
ncbi:hypothetical protein ES703_94085 [subsurface metagenome]